MSGLLIGLLAGFGHLTASNAADVIDIADESLHALSELSGLSKKEQCLTASNAADVVDVVDESLLAMSESPGSSKKKKCEAEVAQLCTSITCPKYCELLRVKKCDCASWCRERVFKGSDAPISPHQSGVVLKQLCTEQWGKCMCANSDPVPWSCYATAENGYHGIPAGKAWCQYETKDWHDFVAKYSGGANPGPTVAKGVCQKTANKTTSAICGSEALEVCTKYICPWYCKITSTKSSKGETFPCEKWCNGKDLTERRARELHGLKQRHYQMCACAYRDGGANRKIEGYCGVPQGKRWCDFTGDLLGGVSATTVVPAGECS